MHAITDATRTGIRAVLADRGPRRQPLPGFDADYHDIVHYILRCTYRIWEQRGIELIDTHYAPNARVVTLGGESRTAQAVIDGTRAMLAAFPDRRLEGEDVIWCALPRDGGYFSSHRIRSTMTHRGVGEFGAPTGRVARYRTIADCYVRGNRIYLEWLARDNLAIVHQLGLDPMRLATRLAAHERLAFVRWRMSAARELLATRAWKSGAPAHASISATTSRWLHAWAAAINARNWNALERLYDSRAVAALPDAQHARSAIGIARYWSSLVDALPDLVITLDRTTELPASATERRIALRWWAAGTHLGSNRFGPTSRAPILMLGVSQFRVDAGAVAREWTVTDELAVLRQIAAFKRRTYRDAGGPAANR